MGIRKIICKSCGKEDIARYDGYCQKCWHYFKFNGYKEFPIPPVGEVGYVTDKNDKQYGMVICSICGKAYTRLQQHIYYAHHIYKKDYCLQFGLDNKVRLTSEEYNKKMRDYAYQYDMPEQLKTTGMSTRFKAGDSHGNYNRSIMTQKRLRETILNCKRGN